LEEARQFKQKVSGSSKMAGLEEQIVALAIKTGWSIEDVYNMSIRKFFIALKRANHMIMSDIYLTASMSGFVTFKDKSVLKGWLADIDVEDKYGDVKMNPEALEGKASFRDAKVK